MKDLYFMLMVAMIFCGCGKDDNDVKSKVTSIQVSTRQINNTDTVPKITDIYLFKGDVKIEGGMSLLEKALGATYSKRSTTMFKTDIEPGIYTIAVQIPITDTYGRGSMSSIVVDIKEGDQLLLKKTFDQYLGSYTKENW